MKKDSEGPQSQDIFRAKSFRDIDNQARNTRESRGNVLGTVVPPFGSYPNRFRKM
jgi:hypothetical protein